jgi:hypothetical protein
MVFTKYVYDKKRYLSLNKKEKVEFIRKTINELVTILNNPDIIEKNENNEDVQHQFHSNCQIIRQIIGDNNLVCTIESTVLKSNNFFTFPIKYKNDDTTYAILKLEECFSIKDLVDELIDILNQI